MNEPIPLPTPEGPISRYLMDPEGYNRRILDALLGWLHGTAGLLVAIGAAVLLLTVALYVLAKIRDRRLRQGGRRIGIQPPPSVDARGGLSFWMGLHSMLRPWWARLLVGQPYIAWEVVGRPEEIEISVWVPRVVPPGMIERAIEASWPGARAFEAEDHFPNRTEVAVTELDLAQPEWFPIGSGPGDALRLVLAALTGLTDGEKAVIQIVARPATSVRRLKLLKAARALKAGIPQGKWNLHATQGRLQYRPPPDPTVEADVRAILEKAGSPLFHSLVRVSVSSPQRQSARGRIHSLAGAFAVFEGRNGFRRRRVPGAGARMRKRQLSRPYLLSVPELAQLANLPAAGTLPGLEVAGARTAAPSRTLPSQGRVLGISDHPGLRGREAAISIEDARHHVHLIGETGTGKSTLIAQMVLEDAAAGRAAVVIDPKGDLVEAILERLPQGAEERTCVLDPDDPDWAVGLDPLRGENHDLVVDHILGVFQRIFEPHWGPRTDDLMRAACLTLKQIPGATLTEVSLLLSDANWRREINYRLRHVAGLNDFWSWYEKLPDKIRNEQIAPLLNKLRAFDLRGPMRTVVGQSVPKRNIESLIDLGGLLLVRLPKGTLGEGTSRLLGALVIARIWQACMKRASRPESERADATLYVDEMHNYLALPRSFEDLLAEARGYRLSLVLAHQHMGQLPRDMREALGANARSKVVMACSPEDANVLERHFAPELSAHDLSHLAAFQGACRPCIEGGHGRPFTFSTKPLGPGSEERAEVVRQRSRELFAERKEEVEKRIRDKHRNAASDLLPPKETDQYPARYLASYGARHDAQPSLRGVETDERAGDKG